jgi:hypothetical protein
MEFDPFARQQGSPQQWSPGGQPGGQQSPPQPPQPLQWQPEQPAQWQPGQYDDSYGSQPQPQQAWGQQPQYRPQYAPPMPDPGGYRPRRSRPAAGCGILIASVVGVAGVVIAVLAATLAHHSSSSASPAISGAPVSLPAVPGQSGAPAGPSTATLVVTGSSGAQVSYGPAGSDLTGSVPMNKTVALGSATNYEIKALLTGGGTLKCEILVGGKVISQASASSAYGAAVCVIFRNPVSGQWQDATAG